MSSGLTSYDIPKSIRWYVLKQWWNGDLFSKISRLCTYEIDVGNRQSCLWQARDEGIFRKKITRNRHQFSWIYSETIQKMLFLINCETNFKIRCLEFKSWVSVIYAEHSIRKQLTTLSKWRLLGINCHMFKKYILLMFFFWAGLVNIRHRGWCIVTMTPSI